MLEGATPLHAHAVVGGVDGGVVPVLDGDEGQLGLGSDDNLYPLRVGGSAGVIQDHGAAAALLGGDEQVAGSGVDEALFAGDLVARHAHAHGALELGASLEGDGGGGLERHPGDDAGAVHRGADGPQALVGAFQALHVHALRGVDGDGDRVRRASGTHGLQAEQRAETLHGREAPFLLAPAWHRDVSRVEGGRAVRTRGDVAPLRRCGAPVRVGAVQARLGVVSGQVGHEVLLCRVPGGSSGRWCAWGGLRRRPQPTEFSICSSMRRLSSRAYSMGSSRAIGSTKPRTIVAMASVSVSPRCMR